MQKLLALVFVVISCQYSYGQHEPIYTQYSMNQAMFNPAYAAVNNIMNFSFMSRKQWVGLEGAPFTNTLLASSSMFNGKGGAGVNIHSNSYGVSTNLELFAQAAYRLKLGLNGQLSIGIQGGYLIYKNDFTKIEEALLDPLFGSVVENTSVSNVGLGIFFNTNNFYLGLSVPKYIEYTSSETDSELFTFNRHYYGSIGAVLPMGLLRLKTTGLIIYSEVDTSYELAASLLMAETIWAGLFTRNFDAFGAMGMFEITDMLKMGLTIELPSTELVTNQYGSYEVFISWEIAAFRNQLFKRRYF